MALDERGRAAAPKANARDITTFTRHVASMLRAGLPLAQTLEVIARTPARSGVPRLAGALARSLNAGTTFAAALAHYPPQFDALYCQLAAVGEASGSLAPVLERMAQERERAAVQRAKVRAALAYPTVVLLFAIAITGALLAWVVPAFQQVFEGFGAALPGPTRAVIALSDAALHYGGACAAALAVAQLVLLFALRRSHAARLALGKLTLAIPLIGRTIAALAAARWCRALGTLLASGIPLADALTSLTHATGHAVFDAASIEIALRLERGERLAAAMHATSTFPSTIIEPVAVAEESGALDAVLLDVAALAEREVDEAVGILTSVAEPLVVIMLGSLVGGLVVALYLPIIELGNVV
ncbi:type II secretion system F family protein [Trinickia sp. LjRoot230]|uniref:type II secretion system F family protein n=1 Tax=Trinickia sp. LjRoot230 TaxID=3342288 RepID=UPI003ECCF8B5